MSPIIMGISSAWPCEWEVVDAAAVEVDIVGTLYGIDVLDGRMAIGVAAEGRG